MDDENVSGCYVKANCNEQINEKKAKRNKFAVPVKDVITLMSRFAFMKVYLIVIY